MASGPLTQTQEAHTARMKDLARAGEIAQRYAGWSVWSARDGKTRVASRVGDQRPPSGDDDVWAATLLADGANAWADLERQLAEQAQHDAELSYLP
jgi:hypothetical protein